MKVIITAKCPDMVEDALQDIEDEHQKNAIYNKCSKWVKWGEYVTIEIDTTEGTAKVLEAS